MTSNVGDDSITELDSPGSPEPIEAFITTIQSRRKRRPVAWNEENPSREPVVLTWRQTFSLTPHWRCLTLTIMITICLILLMWCRLPRLYANPNDIPCRNGLIWIPTTITLLFYMLYIIECMHCNIHKDFSHKVSYKVGNRLLTQWMNAKPVIRWRAICYHYGRGIRQSYQTAASSSNNGGVQHMQFMRINSHCSEGRYYPNDCGCKDKSSPLKSIGNYHIVKVDIEKYFSFGCPCSEAAYLSQRKAFYDNNVAADDFIEVQETFHLSGSEVPDSLCIMRTADSLPWFCRKPIFWLFSLLGLSWPLRILIERRTAYVTFIIHKQFGATCNGILANSGHSVSSYDSKLSENIYGIIPSYSEALLMSSYTLNGTRIPSTICLPHNRNILYESYETIAQTSDRRRKKRSIQSQILKDINYSKTTENLHKACSMRHVFKRSASLYSPIVEIHSPSPDVVSESKPAPKVKDSLEVPIIQRSSTSQNIIRTMKNIVPKSKSVGEAIRLL